MSVVIRPDARRCGAIRMDGNECDTILNRYNPGPNCLCHARQKAKQPFLPLARRFDRPPLKLVEGRRNEVASGITVAA